MKSGGKLQILPWDSDWLGVLVARLVVTGAEAAIAVPAAVTQCRATGIRLLYLPVSPADAAASAAARAVGAELVDIRLTYRLPLTGGAVPPDLLPPGIALVPATALTAPLEELAWLSGEYSRFRRDARIGELAFRALYSRWLRRALAEGVVWVAATANEQTAGLLAFEALDHGPASIALLAVASTARRRHIGQCLVQMARQEAQQRGCAELRVVTQGANQPARQLYEQCGFGLLRTEHYYHLWL